MYTRLRVCLICLLIGAPVTAAAQCQQFSGVFSATVLGTTSGASNDAGSCGGTTAPESTFFYFSPHTGDYTIDTIGSELDTVLYVRNVGGAELGCNDDIAPGSDVQSRLFLHLAVGEMITIIVDGFATHSGTFTLRINGNCPQKGRNDPRDLGSPLSISVGGTTTCGTFSVGGASCGNGGDNAPDVTFLYTAPVAGEYAIDTIGSSFDTLLYVRSGSCAGLELGCSDDIAPSTNKQSRLTFSLTAGQTVLIAVDGFGTESGAFTINISGTPYTPTPSPTRTSTRTPSNTVRPSRTPTSTITPPRTPTRTLTRTPTHTPTRLPSLTPTATFTRTIAPTNSPSRTASPTRSGTAPATSTPTRSPIPPASATRTPTATPTQTASQTTTAPPSSTPTLSATATPTATATPAPSVTPLPTPLPTLTPAVSLLPLCHATATGGFVCRIDFELLPNGRPPVPFADVIRDQYSPDTGVRFPDGGWVIRPLSGTGSPDFALINATSDGQQELNAFPLRMEFDGVGIKRLSVRAGLMQSLSGVRPVLTVFDASGTLSERIIGPPFANGPTAIDQLIEAQPAFTISRAELLYDGDTPTARNAVEVIDDLEAEIEGRLPCVSSDTQAPVVTITSPKALEKFSGGTLPRLAGSILEDSGKLLNVTAEIIGPRDRYSIDLSPYVLANREFPGAFSFGVSNVGLYDGPNSIVVRASDGACPPNQGQDATLVRRVLPPDDLNVYAMALEVTQAIQDELQIREVPREGSDSSVFRPLLYSGIPLVANKQTVVRVYPELEESPGIDAVYAVPALLIVRRGGSETRLSAPGITIDPADQVDRSGGTRDVAQTLARKRASISKSWNFVLPQSATEEGTIDELDVRINPPELGGPVECLGCNDAANRLRVSALQFSKVASLSIRTFYLAQDVDVAAMPGAHQRTFCGTFQRMYPLAGGCGTGAMSRNDFRFGINLLPLTRLDPKINKLVGADGRQISAGKTQGLMCETMYFDGLREPPAFTPPADYFGMFPAGVGTSDGFGGFGGPNHARYFPSACSSGGESNFGVAAQEVGHGILVRGADGRDLATCAWHAPCGSPNCPLASFPTYTNAVGDPFPAGSIGQFGLDTSTLSVLDPQMTFDFMSYCGPVWISPFSYRTMFTHFRNRLETMERSASRTGDSLSPARYLVTSGDVVSDSEVSFGPFYQTTLPSGSSDETGTGPYTLDLRDQNGVLLFVRHFDLPVQAAHDGRPDQPILSPSFRETVPWFPATKQIVCRRGPAILATRLVSANAPVPTLTAPTFGDLWEANEVRAIQWNATDADQDTLLFKVEYSNDAGLSWRTLATDVTDNELTVNTAFIPGGAAALVQVSATDGVNTGAAISASFSVARKDPTIAITGVEENAVVEGGTVLNLLAEYIDPDEEMIPESSFVWRSDQAGVLGTGSHLELPATRLAPGPHQLTLTVPGKQGPPISTRVRILRVPQLSELRPCIGDCNTDGEVTVDELLIGVNIALGNQLVTRCPSFDVDGDSAVTVDEILRAVINVLNGCPLVQAATLVSR
jgi:hypothetical protein